MVYHWPVRRTGDNLGLLTGISGGGGSVGPSPLAEGSVRADSG